METAAQLVSHRVVEAKITDYLADVADQLAAIRSHHCVVLDDERRKFIGVVRLGDIARRSAPGSRILGDLVSAIAPLQVQASEPARDVAALFERHELGEAVVVAPDGSYVGLVTTESVLKWATSTIRVTDSAAQEAKAESALTSRVRAAFLAAVSHELRTPLNPVLLVAADRAASLTLPEDVRKDFAMIAQHVLTEAQLIDDLVDVTRILSGKVPLDRKPLLVHQLLEEVLLDLDLPLRSKRLIVGKQWSAPDDSVYADERRLRQVLEKVLRNSIKFTPTLGQIQISTAASETSGALEIRIQDTGIGIMPEELEKIFVPFSPSDKGDEFLSYPLRGIGLNIPIARRLVELHGGRLAAESAGRNRGTTVVITLQQHAPSPSA